jgi:putative membrane protein
MQPDTRILSILHAKNEEEVRLGRLAIRRGESAAVKRYAEMLVRDHMNNDREVRSTADRLGINLLEPARVEEMLEQEKGQSPSADQPDETDPIGELGILEGAEFDRRFMELMAAGHEDVITLVEQAQRTVTREDVRSLLARTLPRLRHHQAEAQALTADPLRPPTLDAPGNTNDRPGGGG